MKKFLGILLVTAFMLLQATSSLAAETITAMCTPFGTGGYVLTNALEEISKKGGGDFMVKTTETPGVIFNIKKLNKSSEAKKNSIFICSKTSAWMSTQAMGPYKKKYPAPKLIANYVQVLYWLASTSADIKTGKDLVGKKIGLGRAAQDVYGRFPTWIVKNGWDFGSKVQIMALGLKPSLRALLDGNVDAAIMNGFIDLKTGKLITTPLFMELLASGKTVNSIPWGKKAIEKVNAKGYPLTAITLKPGVMKGYDGAFEGVVEPAGWWAYPELPEESAYKTTKLIIDNLDKFIKYHKVLGKVMTPKALLYGFKKEDIHPGALKAYKEAGYIK